MSEKSAPKVLIVEGRFYENYGEMLLNGATKVLKEKGVAYEHIIVPGAFEIPATIAMARKTKKYDAYVTLGCVIRGETTHYDYVCNECARGLQMLATKKRVPLGFGLVTAENREQAETRANPEAKDFGGKAAKAALRMLEVKELFKED